MIDIQFDVSELQQFSDSIDRRIKQIHEGVQKYFKFLEGNAMIEADLKSKIRETVYARPTPDWYERTGDLLKATRVKVVDGQLYLYMDEQWLGTRPQANRMGVRTGFDRQAHSGQGYAWLVEYEHTYQNEAAGHPYTRPGSEYMKQTFLKIQNEIKGGKYDARKILEPLMKGWSQ